MNSTAPRSATTLVNFKEIKARISMVQVLEHYGLMDSLRQSGDRISGPCPIHQGTNTTQFRVSISKNCWNCFGNCGRGGNVIDFVMLKEGIAFRDAALRLQEWFPESNEARVAEASSPAAPVRPPNPTNGSPPIAAAPSESKFENEQGAGKNLPLSFELKSLKQDHPYLTERGLQQSTITSYGIGYCSRGCLKGYIAIPIRDRDGHLMAYIGRWPGQAPEDKPKYKLPKGFKKSLELFNIEHAVKANSSEPLIVVESVFDCLHLVQFGYLRTVALLGSSLSERQEATLRDLAGAQSSIHVFFDADDAGKHGAEDAAKRLCRTSMVRIADVGRYRLRADKLERHEVEALLRNN